MENVKWIWTQEFKVQFGYFRNMFDLDYNIGFGCPVTGSCQKLWFEPNLLWSVRDNTNLTWHIGCTGSLSGIWLTILNMFAMKWSVGAECIGDYGAFVTSFIAIPAVYIILYTRLTGVVTILILHSSSRWNNTGQCHFL